MQQVTGRLTADAVVKTLDSGKTVVNFTIADNETYKPKGEAEPLQISTFFNCSYWLNQSVAQVLRKGAVVQLSGRTSARPYQSNTGDLGASLNFHTNRIEVLAYAQKDNARTATKAGNGKNNAKSKADDDLPF